MEIDERQFSVYEAIRHSGATNMFDTNRVADLSGGYLTRSDVLTIIKNYNELLEQYPDVKNNEVETW